VTVTQESNLFKLSGERENYRGYEVDLIDAGNQYLQFKNGVSLATGITHGGGRMMCCAFRCGKPFVNILKRNCASHSCRRISG